MNEFNKMNIQNIMKNFFWEIRLINIIPKGIMGIK